MIFTKCSHSIATHISPEAAWVFGVIEYWTQVNSRKKKQKSLKNGVYCCYLSWADWAQELPFISEKSIRRSMINLKKSGLISVFKGDAASNRANYYTIDQKGWLKFQAWSSGQLLSVDDGLAMTPVSEQVEDVSEDDLEGLDGGQSDQDKGSMLVRETIDVGQIDQDMLVSVTKMPLYIDIKNNKEVTESNIPVAAKQPTGNGSAQPRKGATAGGLVFEAYALAYEKRYGCQPIRNAAVNSCAKKIYEQVGQEAMALVQHYVGMNKRWYLEKAHSLQTCLADLQAVRTAFVTGKTMTSTRAQEMDKEQSFREVINGIERNGVEEFELFTGISGQTDDYLASPKVLRERASELEGRGSSQSTASLCEKVSVAKPSRNS